MISIIVTCYNVGPFIAEALLSVLALDGVDKEIIVIDDASRDNTVETIEEVAALYPEANITVHRFEENTPGGVAPAANLGLSVAKGDYIAFLDGDDWLYPEAFKRALARLERDGCDFVMVNSNEFIQDLGEFSWFADQAAWANFSPKAYWRPLLKSYLKRIAVRTLQFGPIARRLPQAAKKAMRTVHSRHFKHFSLARALSPSLSASRVLSSDAAKKALLQMGPFPWRKIYRRDFIEENNLRFPEGNWMYEDNPFHWQAVVVAKSFVLHDETTYSHRIWSGQTIAKSSAGALAIFDHAKTIYDHIQNAGKWDAFRDEFTIWLADHIVWAYQFVRVEEKQRVFDIAREVCAGCGLELGAVMRKVSEKDRLYENLMDAYIQPVGTKQVSGEA